MVMTLKWNTLAMARYLDYRGLKYISPQKAGPLKEEMLLTRNLAQEARQEFTLLAQAFSQKVPGFILQKTSQWMNQAQILRPHFWAYLIEDGREVDEPALALRLLEQEAGLGLSLEVSFIERSKSEDTVSKQNCVLKVPTCSKLYYAAQEEGRLLNYEMTEDNRQLLNEKILKGGVRKVLVKYALPDLSLFASQEEFLESLLLGWELLMPYYQATK